MASFFVVVDPALAAYKFSDTHPLHPIRVLNTYAMATELLEHPSVTVSPVAAEVSSTMLEQVHTSDYINAVQAAGGGVVNGQYGLGSLDVPVFENMHEAAVNVCQATLTATQAVANGDYVHAINVGGGLHHAMPSKASGFCVYNDIAVSIQWLLDNGYERIAYIDIDAHHGDGVQAVFYDDPRVLTFSIHESGKTLFPGTGAIHESGTVGAHGRSINIPVPANTSDSEWLRAITSVLPEVLREFDPQMIFSQHGCDSHRDDPLTNLNITIDGQLKAHELIHQYAHDFASGNWIAVGGGGYDLHNVVPKTWTNLLAVATHQPEKATHSDGVEVKWKSFSSGWNPESEIDRIIMQVRKEIFPTFGLPADPNAAF
ncbi:MAG: hypothetical protein RL038_926 [Actinomycetota bacterium]|jgi:acetoin utilization protein AcuC